MGHGPFYTEAELCRAEELKATGLTWAQVAARLGRGRRALMESVAKERRGIRVSARMKAIRERNARMVAAAEAGIRPAVIAQQEGISLPLVCMTLARFGLDAEMRKEIRAERRAA